MAHLPLKTLVSAAAALTALGLIAPAAAQPNPFDDYEEGAPAVPVDLPDEGETAPALPSALDPETPTPAATDSGGDADAARYVLGQWRWSVGLGTQFAYTGTSNELLDGSDRTNRTLFLTLAPRGGVFVIDQLEVTLGLGLLSKLSAREGNSSATENNFFFETAAHYHIPVANSGFAIVPGLGLGGYFGGSAREFTIAGQQLDESTSTRGFLINGYVGVAYQPTPNWRLRSGLAVGALFGSERIKSQDQVLSTSAVHIGLPLELSYVF